MSLFRKKPVSAENPCCGVVIAAAGSSSRMEGVDKLTALLDGEPVLVRAIRPFERSALVREIVVVTRWDRLEEIADLCRRFELNKVTAVVAGGRLRSESVKAGVEKLSRACRLAAVHDGARPLISTDFVDELIRTADRCSAVAPALRIWDTVKSVSEGSGGVSVTETVDRDSLRSVQTPQIFDRDLLEAAHVKAWKEGAALTDDCSALERLGKKVYLTDGLPWNRKITTQEDLRLAEALWKAGLCNEG